MCTSERLEDVDASESLTSDLLNKWQGVATKVHFTKQVEFVVRANEWQNDKLVLLQASDIERVTRWVLGASWSVDSLTIKAIEWRVQEWLQLLANNFGYEVDGVESWCLLPLREEERGILELLRTTSPYTGMNGCLRGEKIEELEFNVNLDMSLRECNKTPATDFALLLDGVQQLDLEDSTLVLHITLVNFNKRTLWSILVIPYLCSEKALGGACANINVRMEHQPSDADEDEDVAMSGVESTEEFALAHQLLDLGKGWMEKGARLRCDFQRRLWKSVMRRRQQHRT